MFTLADVVIALKIAVGSREYDPFWDINRDERVTSLDALMIFHTVAGHIDRSNLSIMADIDHNT